MAKSSNPIDVYRRQQRKKQVQKNKTKRIAARDTKVAETASLDEVKGEIKKLERKKENHNGHLDNKETRKLERLRKELKIVIAAEEDRKKAAEERAKQEWEDKKKRLKTREGVNELNQAKFQHAKASIYYDPVMNPFGAPPPGLAMIFHRRGGGRTMNPDEAFVPYELRDDNDAKSDTDDTVIKEAVSKSTISNEDTRKLANINDRHEHGMRNSMASVPPPPPPVRPPPPPPPSYQKRSGVPPPPPPLPPSTRRPRLPPTQSKSQSQQKIAQTQRESKNNNSQVQSQSKSQSGPPALPKPSEAVQRLNKKKSKLSSSILTDIWASTDEIAYGGDTLEGTGTGICTKQNQNITPRENERAGRGALKKKRRAEDTERFDPLCPAEEGYSEYRSKDQIERSTKRKKQATLSNESSNASSGTTSNETNKKKKPCAWYYIDQSGTCQGPFTSEQMIGWKQAGFFPAETRVRDGEDGQFVQVGVVDLATGVVGDQGKTPDAEGIHKDYEMSDIDSRIAALKETTNEKYEHENETSDIDSRIEALKEKTNEKYEHENETSDIDSRIAALKEKTNEEYEHETSGIDSRIEALKEKTNEKYEHETSGIDSRIAALKEKTNENAGFADEGVSVHPHESHESAYPIADAEAYPCGGDIEGEVREEDDAEAPYPIDTAYPIEDDAEAPYPIDTAYPIEDDAEAPYPIDTAYPIEDEYAYPDTNAAYSVTGGGNDEIGSIPYYLPDDGNTKADDKFTKKCDTKKAAFDGDKAVVGFVPSNLRRTASTKSKGRKVHKRKITQKEITSTSIKNASDGNGVTPSTAIGDEYDVFMKEVNALK